MVRKTVAAFLTFLLGQKTCETDKPRLLLIRLRVHSAISTSCCSHFPFQLELLLGFLSTTSDSISLLLLLSVSVSICQCLRLSLTKTVDCTAHEESEHALLSVILDASQRDELREIRERMSYRCQSLCHDTTGVIHQFTSVTQTCSN